MRSTIDRAGRVVIPKAIREAAGLKPGSPDGKVETERKSPKVRLVRKGAILVASAAGAPKISLEEVNEWIRKSRDREI